MTGRVLAGVSVLVLLAGCGGDPAARRVDAACSSAMVQLAESGEAVGAWQAGSRPLSDVLARLAASQARLEGSALTAAGTPQGDAIGALAGALGRWRVALLGGAGVTLEAEAATAAAVRLREVCGV